MAGFTQRADAAVGSALLCASLPIFLCPWHPHQPPVLSSLTQQLSILLNSGKADVSCSVWGHMQREGTQDKHSVWGHMQREGTQDKHHRETLFITSLLDSKSATSFHGTVLGHLCKGATGIPNLWLWRALVVAKTQPIRCHRH